MLRLYFLHWSDF